ncbi:MAG: DUF2784 domain-containing protein [Planctomycetota bacterium]
MDRQALYRLAADAMLVTHVGIVAFVIGGLLLTLLGGALGWSWVRNRWFRGLHLLTILIIIAQAWLGIVCPLTTWEMQLRRAAGQQTYDETFIAYWLGNLLFIDAAPWVFITTYSAFGGLVLLSLWWVPVRWTVSLPRDLMQKAN